jgi:hypothetical protein
MGTFEQQDNDSFSSPEDWHDWDHSDVAEDQSMLVECLTESFIDFGQTIKRIFSYHVPFCLQVSKKNTIELFHYVPPLIMSVHVVIAHYSVWSLLQGSICSRGEQSFQQMNTLA